MNDSDLVEAQRVRFRNQVLRTADRLRVMADEIERIRFEDHRGWERQPVAVIGEVTHIVLWGVANLNLDTLAGEAEGLYDLRAYEPGQPKCGYTIKDPDTVCVLSAGHVLPVDAGMVVHMSADGVMFL